MGILTVHEDKDVLTIKMNTKESKLFSWSAFSNPRPLWEMIASGHSDCLCDS